MDKAKTYFTSFLSRNDTPASSDSNKVTRYCDASNIGDYTFNDQLLVADPKTKGKVLLNYDAKTFGELFENVKSFRRSWLTADGFELNASLKPAEISEEEGMKFVQRYGAGPYSSMFRVLGRSKEDEDSFGSFPVRVQWEVWGEVCCTEDTFQGEGMISYGDNGGDRKTRGSKLGVQVNETLKEQLDEHNLWDFVRKLSDEDVAEDGSSTIDASQLAEKRIVKVDLVPLGIIHVDDNKETTDEGRTFKKGKGRAPGGSQASELGFKASVSCTLDFTAREGEDED